MSTSDVWTGRRAVLLDHSGSLGGVVGNNGVEQEERDAAQIAHCGNHREAQTDCQLGCHVG